MSNINDTSGFFAALPDSRASYEQNAERYVAGLLVVHVPADCTPARLWPGAEIVGFGRYAVLHSHGPRLRVELTEHPVLVASTIDNGCAAGYRRDHSALAIAVLIEKDGAA